jgi:hypothetical protein
MILQGLREREQIENLLAAEVGEIQKAFHAGMVESASRS